MCKEKLKEISAKDWIIIVLIIIILLLTFGCALYYHKYLDAEGLVVIWNDSTYVYKNKYNEEYQAKNTYILEADQLKKYNEELYKEYKSLKDNPVVITKTVIVTKIDSVGTNTHDAILKDSLLAWNWEANDSNYYAVSGSSRANLAYPDSSETFIDNIEVDAKLSLDVIDNGEQLSVIARSDNPYMCLGPMQSVVIDPKTSPTLSKYYKPKRWGFSIYFGAGVNVGYDPIHNNVGLNIGPSAGFAITYDLVQW